MSKAESACSRTPVEIWKEIFQHFVGPSLSNPRHSSVRDYKRYLFAYGSDLLRSHIQRERKRSTLRLVSHNWKLVADLMADQIVFIRGLHGQTPANISLAHAKHIYYGSTGLETFFSNVTPLKFGEAAHLAQIVQVGHRDIFFSGHLTIQPQDNVLAFSWEPRGNSPCFEKLAHESLRSLVALSLTLHQSSSPTERPTLDLPMLRYLHMYLWGCDSQYLTRWYFPVLRYLSLKFGTRSTASIGDLIHRHSATIEELQLFGEGEGDGDGEALAYCLSGLPRLKTYIPCRLSTINCALSQLEDLLGRTTNSNTSPDDRLVIQLLSVDSFSPPQSATTPLLQRVKNMKKNVHFKLWQSWDELTEKVEEVKTISPLAFYKMIKILRIIPDIVFDSEEASWRTAAARRFESAVLAVVDD